MKLTSDQIKKLREARLHLEISSVHFHNLSHDTDLPFRIKKLFNVMGKEAAQIGMEILVLLGTFKEEEIPWEIKDFCSLNILKTILKETR